MAREVDKPKFHQSSLCIPPQWLLSIFYLYTSQEKDVTGLSEYLRAFLSSVADLYQEANVVVLKMLIKFGAFIISHSNETIYEKKTLNFIRSKLMH